MKPSAAKYVDGYVLVVPKKKLPAYRKLALLGAKVWYKHGALDYKECVGEDIRPKAAPDGLLTFVKMTKLKPGEVVLFSFITFKSRAHRDRVNAKVMKDPLMNNPDFKDKSMPFDTKRMAYAGFEVLVG